MKKTHLLFVILVIIIMILIIILTNNGILLDSKETDEIFKDSLMNKIKNN